MTTQADAARTIYNAYEGYWHMTPALAWKIVDVAEALSMNPYDLANLIRYESQFSPRAQNPVSKTVVRVDHGQKAYAYNPIGPKGRPPATGLVQFLASTLEPYGFTTKDVWNMTAVQQMDLVEAYLRDRFKERKLPTGVTPTVHQIHMAVFQPSYFWKSPNMRFPDYVIDANRKPDGTATILTPADYTREALAAARLTSSGKIRERAPVRGWFTPHPDELSYLMHERPAPPSYLAA
jgi:hypothetical protein